MFFSQKPEFSWTSVEKGFILSSFSWGYSVSIVGGMIACKYGGTNVFALGLLGTALLTLLTPYLIQFNFTFYVMVRICEGVTEVCGFSFLKISQWKIIIVI